MCVRVVSSEPVKWVNKVIHYEQFVVFSNGASCHGVSCPWDELSVGRLVHGASFDGASCPWSELSIGRAVLGASCPWGELSMGRVIHGTSCLWREITVGQVLRGASFDGASGPETA